MYKLIFIFIAFLLLGSSFSQTPIVPQVEKDRNILFHINKASNNYFFSFTISPWGNWVFACKEYKNAAKTDYRDSAQLFLISVFDTNKSIWLLTLFPKADGKCKVYVGNYTGSTYESWSAFQDKVYFGVQGSTINENEYMDSPFDYEIFSLDVSKICSIKIPNFEYTPYTVAAAPLSKQISPNLNRISSTISPNPSQGKCEIRFSIPSSNPTVICIYDGKGSLVRVLFENNSSVGNHIVHWDGCTNDGNVLPSGGYYYQIASGKLMTTKKLMLLK